MNTSPHLDNANIGPLARGRSRRAFLRMLVAGSGVSALGTLAAACGPAGPSAPATTTAAKPTGAPVGPAAPARPGYADRAKADGRRRDGRYANPGGSGCPSRWDGWSDQH